MRAAAVLGRRAAARLAARAALLGSLTGREVRLTLKLLLTMITYCNDGTTNVVRPHIISRKYLLPQNAPPGACGGPHHKA